MPNASAAYPSLAGRTVVVTGGGSGIGAAFVEAFAVQGARVAFLDLAIEPSQALVATVAGRCAHAPLFVPCDLTDIAALRSGLAHVARLCGDPQVLVNNAGNDDRHNFADVTPAYFDQRLALNLKHQYFAAQAVAPAMVRAGAGSILNLSSIAWMIPSAQLSVYEMAKAAVIAMTKALAHELGPAGVRVNCILPGMIATERQRRLWLTPAYEREVLSRQSLQRVLEPSDVAHLALFLAADDSSAITSQSHIVDGGWM